MEIDKGTGPAVWTNKGDPIYVNADKSAVVPGDSPEAAFLLVGTDGQIPLEEAQKYGLIGSQLPEGGRGQSKLGQPLPEADRALADADETARRLEEAEAEAKKARDAADNKKRGTPPENKRG